MLNRRSSGICDWAVWASCRAGFAVLLSSMLGFLLLPLGCVFFTFSFQSVSFLWVGLLLCLVSTSLEPSWGCFSQVTSGSWQPVMSGECVISSVLSCCSKDLKRRSSVFCCLFCFIVMELISRLSLGQSFWLRVLPSGAHIAQPRWMPARRILGGGRTRGVSFWPFLNSSSWWQLVSSLFLTRTSYLK